jgi:ketosteroid isomerase-like protein
MYVGNYHPNARPSTILANLSPSLRIVHRATACHEDMTAPAAETSAVSCEMRRCAQQELVSMNRIKRSRFRKSLRQLGLTALVMLPLAAATAQQNERSGDGAHVLALDNSWNRALEDKDIKALDLILADTVASVDIDGSRQSKAEFLASIKAPDYHPPAQAVTEQSSVEVYGDSAVVVGIFRTKFVEKGKKFVNRERFVDTWARIDGIWKCVATVAVLISSKPSAE